MRCLIALFALLLPLTSMGADPRIKIAVIDTGMSGSLLLAPFYCKDGHKDLSHSGLRDRHGHGSMVASHIARSLDPLTHCIVSIKWVDFDHEVVSGAESILREIAAIEYATSIGVFYINISLTGQGEEFAERIAIKKALNKGIMVAVAAGNQAQNLSLRCDIYPACYARQLKDDKFRVVASYYEHTRRPSSNYGGPVNSYEDGGTTGTSLATAIFLGKFIRGTYENKACGNTCTTDRRMPAKDQR